MVSAPAVIVSDLTYAYPDGVRALAGLSFSIPPGESVGLLGPNGAGKTTLFLCLCGVLKTMLGAVRVAGLDPADPAQRKQLPAQVGVAFQNSDDQLFSPTVFDDVAFGPLNLGLPADEVKERVTSALGQVEMTGQEQRVPFHLSGGEKRRAALAGVLAMRPSVLLLDEPSMFLDPRGRRELIRIINDLPGTKLIATHDLALVRQTCSRVLLLDHGELVADGPAEQIMRDAALMEKHGLEAV
jgi:cobalt/nickel transport system ATP-binding protein